jgi:Kef-type K+ transport system membrane component KefB/voltage-gated potassium channel Kch
MNIFIELSSIIVIATIVSFIMRLFRQPLVVGYIISGILVGPYVLNLLHSVSYIEFFSKIGIAILLFIVGLSLNPLVIREVGKTSILAGLGQVIFTTVIGYGVVRALGFDVIASLYTAIALTLSSTIIILKLLSDKGDLDKLYGRIAIGILLVQDIVATLILIIIPTLSQSQGSNLAMVISLLCGKGVVAVGILFMISRYLLSRISSYFASSQELLFMFSLAWGFGISSLFAGIGFSAEIGALIAGVALSVSPFAYEIGSRMKPLRDFFIMLFFVLLGSQMVLSDLNHLIYPAIILALFVLVGNPLIVLILMNLLGYKRKTSFLTGLTVAQISEFSLILASLGLSLGYLNRDVVSLITLVGVVTIAGSTYLILYSQQIYHRLEWLIKLFEIRRKLKREKLGTESHYDAVIFGYDRVGMDFVHAVRKLEKSYLVVDFSPTSIQKLQKSQIPYRYGDAEDVEFLEELGLDQTQLVVSTVPDFQTNLLLVKTYRRFNVEGIILVLSHDVKHARELYLAGASYVVMPHYLGAHYAAQMILRHGFDNTEFERERNLHLNRLTKREDF